MGGTGRRNTRVVAATHSHPGPPIIHPSPHRVHISFSIATSKGVRPSSSPIVAMRVPAAFPLSPLASRSRSASQWIVASHPVKRLPPVKGMVVRPRDQSVAARASPIASGRALASVLEPKSRRSEAPAWTRYLCPSIRQLASLCRCFGLAAQASQTVGSAVVLGRDEARIMAR